MLKHGEKFPNGEKLDGRQFFGKKSYFWPVLKIKILVKTQILTNLFWTLFEPGPSSSPDPARQNSTDDIYDGEMSPVEIIEPDIEPTKPTPEECKPTQNLNETQTDDRRV